MSQKNYQVEGLTSENAVASVEDEISIVPGTQGVDFDIDNSRIVVTGEGFSDDDIIAAVELAGCKVVPNQDTC
ncbi:heavy-metal-associated domain-containing protein [Corynebacterium callunae]|uniref:heavy-metal-associated domain-containing protein n=1 Tax=Corynebacterium callunae TaxID=1721 RepID=UPI0039827A55